MVLWLLKAGGAGRYLQLNLIDYPWDAELFTETLHRWEDVATFQLLASCSSPSMALAEFSPVCRPLAAARRELGVERKRGALIRAGESLERPNQRGPDAACVGFMRFVYVVSTWKRAHIRGSEGGPERFLYRQCRWVVTRWGRRGF